MDIQKLKAGSTLNVHPIDTDGGVFATFGLSEVHSELFGLLGIENHTTRTQTSSL